MRIEPYTLYTKNLIITDELVKPSGTLPRLRTRYVDDLMVKQPPQVRDILPNYQPRGMDDQIRATVMESVSFTDNNYNGFACFDFVTTSDKGLALARELVAYTNDKHGIRCGRLYKNPESHLNVRYYTLIVCFNEHMDGEKFAALVDTIDRISIPDECGDEAVAYLCDTVIF